jgi:KDO2-lipid IV(A) lauroyltransferase
VAQRSAVRNAVEYALVRCVLATVAIGPLGLARFYLRLVARFVPKLRQVAIRNLMLTHQPLGHADDVFDSLARMLYTFARFPRINRANVKRWIRYDGYEHFEAALAKGKGVLFATAHLGNWELSAYAHALLSTPMHVVVRPLDNPLLDQFVEKRRSLSGNHIIGKKDFLRGILHALHSNEAVGVLVDQNVSLDEGIFVDFFGTPACVSPTFAKLAARTGATVIPGFAVWSRRERRYVLKFYPPVEITGDEQADTQRIQTAVERAIREYPEQWLWIHRRWKTRPPDSEPLY